MRRAAYLIVAASLCLLATLSRSAQAQITWESGHLSFENGATLGTMPDEWQSVYGTNSIVSSTGQGAAGSDGYLQMQANEYEDAQVSGVFTLSPTQKVKVWFSTDADVVNFDQLQVQWEGGGSSGIQTLWDGTLDPVPSGPVGWTQVGEFAPLIATPTDYTLHFSFVGVDPDNLAHARFDTTTTPEPGTFALFAAGVGLVARKRRRRATRKA